MEFFFKHAQQATHGLFLLISLSLFTTYAHAWDFFKPPYTDADIEYCYAEDDMGNVSFRRGPTVSMAAHRAIMACHSLSCRIIECSSSNNFGPAPKFPKAKRKNRFE